MSSTAAISALVPNGVAVADRVHRLGSASLGASPRQLSQLPPEQQAREVGRQFEAILVRQLLQEGVGKSLMGGDGAQSNVYGYMMTDMLADQLTHGSGFGLGQMLARQLAPHPHTPTASSTKSSS
ncbi:MAG TPA: rod-binding protein [Opitutus sp.]|nr:rod-binding protein [Opitutus sp.]